jgi:dihydrofolate reductase
MATVFSAFSMSLDGFIAFPDDSVGPLFDWFTNGDVEVNSPGVPPMRMTAASARSWHRLTDDERAFVCGRRLFDYTQGWGGTPPLGVPTFVVTHRPPPADWPPVPDAPYTFVTDGLESALDQAKAVAGDGKVSVAGADIAQQCLNAGLLDMVHVALVPVLLGEGVRYFDHLTAGAPVELGDPEVVEGDRVTHLTYRVRRR